MKPKTIDLNWLEEQDACSEGVQWFKHNFPTHSAPTGQVVQELIKQGREGHFGWLMWALSGKNKDYCYTLNRAASGNNHEEALADGRSPYYAYYLRYSTYEQEQQRMHKMWQRVQDIEVEGMYVTYAALEEHRACHSGLEAFEERYGKDTSVHLEDLIEDTINTVVEEDVRRSFLAFFRGDVIPHMHKDAEMTDRMYAHCLNNMPEEEFKKTLVYEDYEEDKHYGNFYIGNLVNVPEEYLLGCYTVVLERMREVN